MPFQTIRDRLVTLIGAAAGMGVLHNRERAIPSGDKTSWLATVLPDDPGPINVWYLSRRSRPEPIVAASEQDDVVHSFVLEGYYAHDDDVGGTEGSDLTFQAIVDAVHGQLRFAGDLSGDAFRVARHDTATLDFAMLVEEHRCHHAVIEIDVEERILGTNSGGAVPAAPAALQHDELMTALDTTLTGAPISATVTRGRNFPLRRAQRAALMVRLAEEDVERGGGGVTLYRFPVRVRLSYDVADTPGERDAATGEDAARHIADWTRVVRAAFHRVVTHAVTGLVQTEAQVLAQASERTEADLPWRVRAEAELEVSAFAWV